MRRFTASESTCCSSVSIAGQDRALPSSPQQILLCVVTAADSIMRPHAQARILARSMQELVQCSLDVAPVVLKSFDGTLSVAAGELHDARNVLRLRRLLPRGAASEPAAVELLTENGFQLPCHKSLFAI
jgi:hypothetical protein